MAAFQSELGYAKCALPAGIAARLASAIIIESLEVNPPVAGSLGINGSPPRPLPQLAQGAQKPACLGI
jgi:hypothetical protein